MNASPLELKHAVNSSTATSGYFGLDTDDSPLMLDACLGSLASEKVERLFELMMGQDTDFRMDTYIQKYTYFIMGGHFKLEFFQPDLADGDWWSFAVLNGNDWQDLPEDKPDSNWAILRSYLNKLERTSSKG